MNWNDQFAVRTQLMRRGAVRELLKITAQPDIISFAGGLPAAELFAVDRVREAADAVLKQVGAASLQYAPTEGVSELRDWIAARFSSDLERLGRENILVTSGAQQALDLIGRVLLDPGDRVLVENPTYLALLSAWCPSGSVFLPVSSDGEGMKIDELEVALRQRPKLIYLMPNFQNPQGTTLSHVRREQLIEMISDKPVAVVEDNAYGDLRYSGAELSHLLELEMSREGFPDQIIYTGTFSKVLMPGLRVGYVIAHAALIDKLVQAKQAADLQTSTLTQRIVLELLDRGFLDDCVPILCNAYRERRDCMLAALEAHFPPSATWTRPDGGMFLLVTLADGQNTADLLPAALEQKVAFVPGGEFHLNGAGRNTMRLNFSNASPERIQVGIERLGRVIREAQSRGYPPAPRPAPSNRIRMTV